MSITAGQVKELRERTGAGMLECKKALQEADGDVDLAVENLRKSGQAKAAKRSGRIAAEGAVKFKVSDDGKTAAIVEVNCETDFVGRDENFLSFVDQVAQIALQNKTQDIAALADADYGDGKNVETVRQELVAKIGENIQLRRVTIMQSDGSIGTYSHGGRIGVIVSLDKDNIDFAKDIALHIAASNPIAIDESGISADILDKEREIYRAQAEQSGKPAEIVTKMIEGRLKKYLKEVSLVEQPFVKDPQETVGKLVEKAGAKVQGFVRYEVGEGIEKEDVDFAKEVMEQVQGN